MGSFLLILINIARFAVALALAVTLGIWAIGSDVAVQIGPLGSPSVVAGSNVQMAIPVAFSVDTSFHPVSAPDLGISDAQIQDIRGTLKFRPQNGAFRHANLALVVVLLALILWILWELRALIGTLRAGKPFARSNASRIQRIGIALIIAELARAAVVYFDNYCAMVHVRAEGLTFYARPDVNAAVIVSGLIILLVAEAFRTGIRLDEEQSLTV